MRLKLSIRQLEQHNPRNVIYETWGLPMKPKYDLLKAIGPGIRNNLMPPSTLPTDLQVLLLRLAMQEAERAHYRGSRDDLRRQAGVSARA
jgi:hypothetical protein